MAVIRIVLMMRSVSMGAVHLLGSVKLLRIVQRERIVSRVGACLASVEAPSIVRQVKSVRQGCVLTPL